MTDVEDRAAEPPDREPDWDMTPYFPVFQGEEYRSFRASLEDEIESLQARAARLGRIEASNLEAWAALLTGVEGVSTRSRHLASYLGCLSAADARDQDVQREVASASRLRAEIHKLYVAVRIALRETEDSLFEELIASQRLERAAYFLRRLRQRASWSMALELENLAADLEVTGLTAWGRLYDQVSGKLQFDLRVAGQPSRRLPVSMARSLMEDPDPAVRRAALEGANAAWESVGDVLAACLNSISGTRLCLYRRRGVAHFLDPALFDAGITRRTFDTLLDVVTSRREVARRYLRHKARILGLPKLGFQDLTAPLPIKSIRPVPWEEARPRLLAAFGSLYPDLESLARRAFEKSWIDYRPRAGKRPGGFCSTSPLISQSRVFLTFNQTLGDVSTLAHELGHAFHGWVMRELRPWAQVYPMTLAETASTFAEQLLSDTELARQDSTAEERAVILDRRLEAATAFLLNIPMRLQFERQLYERRDDGELTVATLKSLMLEAQREWYGDCLAEEELDPWFWASKMHFYITDVSFYNFPYSFGYLFSLAIFARVREEGPSFLPRYEELLRLTGSDTAEGVAARSLGVDLEEPAFWHSSIDLIEEDLERFLEVTRRLFPRADLEPGRAASSLPAHTGTEAAVCRPPSTVPDQ